MKYSIKWLKIEITTSGLPEFQKDYFLSRIEKTEKELREMLKEDRLYRQHPIELIKEILG